MNEARKVLSERGLILSEGGGLIAEESRAYHALLSFGKYRKKKGRITSCRSIYRTSI